MKFCHSVLLKGVRDLIQDVKKLNI